MVKGLSNEVSSLKIGHFGKPTFKSLFPFHYFLLFFSKCVSGPLLSFHHLRDLRILI